MNPNKAEHQVSAQTNNPAITREQWLNISKDALKPFFEQSGYHYPEKVRLTCGWPSKSATSAKKRCIGECWNDTASKDNHFEIFISPTLDNHLDVLTTLIHELGHAIVGLKNKHNATFKRCIKKIGIEGRTTNEKPTQALIERLNAIVAEIGDYPHGSLNAASATSSNDEKKQSTRLIKAECPCCGYTIRTTKKWLDTSGAPLCPTKNCDNYTQSMEQS